MERLFLIRGTMVKYYKRFETPLFLLFKFVVGLIIFGAIGKIGFYRPEFAPLVEDRAFLFNMLMALLFAVLAPGFSFALAGLCVVLQVSQSIEVAAFTFVLLFLILTFYARLDNKRAFLIIATVVGFYFKIPYAVVLFAGLYFGIASIFPIICGTLIWSFTPLFDTLLSRIADKAVSEGASAAQSAGSLLESAGSSDQMQKLLEVPTGFIDTYKLIYESFTSNFDWVFMSFSFLLVLIVVHAISSFSIDYSKDIALGAGAVLNILCFVIANIVSDSSFGIGGVFIFTIVSVAIVEAVKFFDAVLDYRKTERTQFEDDENYYYVKIVPKIIAGEMEAVSAGGHKRSKSVLPTEREVRGSRGSKSAGGRTRRPPVEAPKPSIFDDYDFDDDDMKVVPSKREDRRLPNLQDEIVEDSPRPRFFLSDEEDFDYLAPKRESPLVRVNLSDEIPDPREAEDIRPYRDIPRGRGAEGVSRPYRSGDVRPTVRSPRNVKRPPSGLK